jgi:hypothetical protein
MIYSVTLMFLLQIRLQVVEDGSLTIGFLTSGGGTTS